jgi:hypothetical protein
MRPADLINRLEGEPFRPFRIHLSDGTKLDVLDKGMVIVGLSSAVLPSAYAKDEEGHRLAKQWRTIALLHIVQFTDLDESRNGRKRRR